MVESNAFVGQALGWVSMAALVALLSLVATLFLERRKLARSERIRAYSSFRGSVSRWTKEIRAIGAIRKKPDFSEESEEFLEAKSRVTVARDDMYDAYAQVEMVAPHDVVLAAHTVCILNDVQYKAFFDPSLKGVPAEKFADALANFTAKARKDLGLNSVNRSEFKESKIRALE